MNAFDAAVPRVAEFLGGLEFHGDVQGRKPRGGAATGVAANTVERVQYIWSQGPKASEDTTAATVDSLDPSRLNRG